MSKVTLLVATVPATLPAGITAGLMRLSILDTTGATIATQDVSGTTADFDAPAAGDYVASAQRLDSTGANLGDAATSPFTVAPSAVSTFDAPQSIIVTIG